MNAIVCDIGHTIILESVLNRLLENAGKSEAMMTLYDEDRLLGCSQKQIDTWVTRITRHKIAALKGVSLHEIDQACRQVRLRAGFEEFAKWVRCEEIPILFIGAVPIVVTRALLQRVELTDQDCHFVTIEGSNVFSTNGCIHSAGVICTPSLKLKKAIEWTRMLGERLEDMIVIGDSIGDIPTMLLTRRQNRYGVCADSQALRNITKRIFPDFSDILSHYLSRATRPASEEAQREHA